MEEAKESKKTFDIFDKDTGKPILPKDAVLTILAGNQWQLNEIEEILNIVERMYYKSYESNDVWGCRHSNKGYNGNTKFEYDDYNSFNTKASFKNVKYAKTDNDAEKLLNEARSDTGDDEKRYNEIRRKLKEQSN